MDADTAYTLGLTWGSTLEEFTIYPEMKSFAAFEQSVGGEWAGEFFGEWEDGVMASPKIVAGDAPLGVRRIAEMTGFNRSYIKAEIKAGRLLSRLETPLVGKPYHEIQPADFVAWVNTSKRGNRAKNQPRE